MSYSSTYYLFLKLTVLYDPKRKRKRIEGVIGYDSSSFDWDDFEIVGRVENREKRREENMKLGLKNKV